MTARSTKPAAYGGPGWSPRTSTLADEIGTLWAPCGVSSEWDPLRAVLLHRPGPEILASADPDSVQMLAPVDPDRASSQHDGLAAAYREAGVEVHLLEPASRPPPNLLFVADLLFMTPEGAILARPASTVRAGEERILAARLADLGVPILRSIRGSGTFEGADAAWIGPRDVLLGRGPRTNAEGASQVASILSEAGVRIHLTDLHPDTMHLMGQVRFLASDLAIAWKRRIDPGAILLLESSGFEVLDVPSEDEAISGLALNLVTLGPRSVVMASGNPVTRSFLEARGVACREVPVDELARAAGGIACMTGILERARGRQPGDPRAPLVP